jgi:LacI family transcriptional regulator
MSNQNFRIKDIAKKAGVSSGTVDRVLHNRGKVSDEAMRKVNAVLGEIDYKPNLLARTLGSKKSFSLAAIIPNQEDDPYWIQCKKGVDSGAEEWSQFGITVRIFLFDKLSGSSFIKSTQEALNSAPDGILIAPIFLHEARAFFKYWKENNIPYVLFNTNLNEAHPLSFIGQNLFESGKVAGELMLLGHQEQAKVVVLHIDEDVNNSPHLIEKEKGFLAYCNSLPFHVEVISINVSHAKKYTLEKIIESISKDAKVTGILVTTSKETALVASLLEQNKRNDLRLIGYDLLHQNLVYLKKGVIKFLINQNPTRQTSLGVSHLANFLLFKKVPPSLDLFPLEIVTKENLSSYLNSGIH